jgi:hypothetical protein
MGFQPMQAAYEFENWTNPVFPSLPLAVSRDVEAKPSHCAAGNRERQTWFIRMDCQPRLQRSRHGLEAHVTDAFHDLA